MMNGCSTEATPCDARLPCPERPRAVEIAAPHPMDTRWYRNEVAARPTRVKQGGRDTLETASLWVNVGLLVIATVAAGIAWRQAHLAHKASGEAARSSAQAQEARRAASVPRRPPLTPWRRPTPSLERARKRARLRWPAPSSGITLNGVLTSIGSPATFTSSIRDRTFRGMCASP